MFGDVNTQVPNGAYTYLTGGARSGKSSFAVRLGKASGRPVTFVATGEPLDDEMTERIARHKEERPADWVTVEEPVHVAEAVTNADPRAFIIVDCLSLWVSNLTMAEVTQADIEQRANNLVIALLSRGAPAVVVSNEVGMGIVPENAMAREYRDVLGRVNAILSRGASDAFLLTAGRTLRLDEPPLDL